MPRSRIAFYVFVALALTAGCEEKSDGKVVANSSVVEEQTADPAEVVAKVNGVPILKEQLAEIMGSIDGGVSVEEALEISIRNELLAQEAERRGKGLAKEVQYAREIELARHLLKNEIGEDINAGTLDVDKLKRLYEANKHRFVHGVLRSVAHILAIVDEKHFREAEASKLAAEIAERAGSIRTKEEFVELGGTYVEKYGDKIRIEALPPFDAESGMFVKEFVDATFKVPQINQASPPVKTKFGWHVLFVWDEKPSKNRSFEDVRAELSEQVLPYERQIKAKELLETLEKSGNVFVHEDALRNYLEKQ